MGLRHVMMLYDTVRYKMERMAFLLILYYVVVYNVMYYTIQ